MWSGRKETIATAIGQQDGITVLNRYDQTINHLFRRLISYCYGQTHGQGNALWRPALATRAANTTPDGPWGVKADDIF